MKKNEVESKISDFRPFGKVHRLGKEETEGILEGMCYVQEKWMARIQVF